ncbi:unnamed protein product [Vicia faba]|uniref:Uncharacterized protein n=1 Tax=Vicia faba TaxID=3906 RepID=A0AAV1AAE7_VICFA|nr:unnamed protein product [Vicia faba]
MEFLKYKQKLVDYTKPTVILLKYANVKEQGKFPLVVTSTYNVTNIHINKDMPNINDFIKRLPKESSFGKSLSTTNTHTRGLDEIIQLGEPTFCITVSTINKLIALENGRYYRACHQCPQVAKGKIALFSVEMDTILKLRFGGIRF